MCWLRDWGHVALADINSDGQLDIIAANIVVTCSVMVRIVVINMMVRLLAHDA